MMDQRLFDAAITGDVALHELLNEDPLILDKICVAEFSETPLHVAALAGKTEFAKEIMRLMPCFVMEINKDGFAPLHLASARGHVEVVMELLKLDNDYSLCFQKDKSGQIPLHHAVARGRIYVVEKLISHCSESLQRVTTLGETVLHLAVKNSQFEVLKLVFERLKGLECFETLLSTKDNKGKTIVELAQATKQEQVLELLEYYRNADTGPGIDEIGELGADKQADQHQTGISADRKQNENQESTEEGKKKNYDRDNLLLVAAVLIATVTYQALVTPPSSIWEKGVNLDSTCIFQKSHREKYDSLLKRKHDCPAMLYYFFVIVNSAGFFSSAVLIQWVTMRHEKDDVPLKLISVSIFLLGNNYLLLIIGLSPDTTSYFVVAFGSVLITVFFWIVNYLIKEYMGKFIKDKMGKFIKDSTQRLVSFLGGLFECEESKMHEEANRV